MPYGSSLAAPPVTGTEKILSMNAPPGLAEPVGSPVFEMITRANRSSFSATTLKPISPPQSCPKKVAF